MSLSCLVSWGETENFFPLTSPFESSVLCPSVPLSFSYDHSLTERKPQLLKPCSEGLRSQLFSKQKILSCCSFVWICYCFPIFMSNLCFMEIYVMGHSWHAYLYTVCTYCRQAFALLGLLLMTR